jgi:DNA-binding GntR family transcriptional regulator
MSSETSLRAVPQLIRNQVESGLRSAISSGRFAPGQHLTDRMLCEVFGASRTIVREAVRLLEAEGLIVTAPNRGQFVAFLSSKEAAQIYELRGVLEALCAEAFAIRASEEDRAALRACYERLAAMDAGCDRMALLDIKRDFYNVLMRGSQNAMAGRVLEQMLNRVTHLRATSLSHEGRLTSTVRELRQIVEAIENRDAEGAWEASRYHVKRAATVALQVLRERERVAASEQMDAAQTG